MRTFHADDLNVFYNSDLSGDAVLDVFVEPVVVKQRSLDGSEYWTLRLPCASLAEFSRRAVLSEVISMVEEMLRSSSPVGLTSVD